MSSATLGFGRQSAESIAQPPTTSDRLLDRLIRLLTLGVAWSIIGLGTYIVLTIAWTARPAAIRN